MPRLRRSADTTWKGEPFSRLVADRLQYCWEKLGKALIGRAVLSSYLPHRSHVYDTTLGARLCLVAV